MSGVLLLFVDESRKLCKVLVCDATGLCIFQKRRPWLFAANAK